MPWRRPLGRRALPPGLANLKFHCWRGGMPSNARCLPVPRASCSCAAHTPRRSPAGRTSNRTSCAQAAQVGCVRAAVEAGRSDIPTRAPGSSGGGSTGAGERRPVWRPRSENLGHTGRPYFSRAGFMGGGAHPQDQGTGGSRIVPGEYTPPNARLPRCTGCGDRGRRGGQRDPHLAFPR
jgi:hypothetical protein